MEREFKKLRKIIHTFFCILYNISLYISFFISLSLASFYKKSFIFYLSFSLSLSSLTSSSYFFLILNNCKWKFIYQNLCDKYLHVQRVNDYLRNEQNDVNFTGKKHAKKPMIHNFLSLHIFSFIFMYPFLFFSIIRWKSFFYFLFSLSLFLQTRTSWYSWPFL